MDGKRTDPRGERTQRRAKRLGGGSMVMWSGWQSLEQTSSADRGGSSRCLSGDRPGTKQKQDGIDETADA